MKRLVFLLASGLVLSLGAIDAAAQDRNRGDRSRGDYRGDPSRQWSGHRDGRRWDGHRDGRHWRHDGYRRHHHHHHRYWGGHYWRPYWDYPRWWWYYGIPAIPLHSYPYWDEPVVIERIVEPEPVIVERIYEPPPRPIPEPVPPRQDVERPYAQVTPPARPQPVQPQRIERMTLSATELFDFDKATLRMPQPKLDEIADVMRRNAQIDKVTITGYTDRLGSDEYNMRLSQRRADAVKQYLVSKGVAAHRLVAVGKGESNPVVQCGDKDRAALIRCLEPNRRVEVEQITVERRR